MARKGKDTYGTSFTAGGLLHRETNAVLELLLSDQAEELLVQEAAEDRLIHINSESARIRSIREIRYRNRVVGKNFWQIYAEMPENFQKLMLFFACLKTYRLVFDFHFDVTLPNWKKTGNMPEIFSYEWKMDELAGKIDQVGNLSDTTRRKLVTVYRRMLKEAELVRTQKIFSAEAPDDFWCYFIKSGDAWFLEACFLDNLKRKKTKESCR